MALLAQHEVHLFHQNDNEQLSAVVPVVVVRNCQPALSNALATALEQAASPALQVTASTSITPSTTEASSSR